MPITHEWNGTVLTITSDSGTSSCDLKGDKGDDGARGAQGAPGSCFAEDTQKLGGIPAAEYALKSDIGSGGAGGVSIPAAYNLLDNSKFEINQRNKTTYNEIGYTLDRWRLTVRVGNLETSENGITFTATDSTGATYLEQRIPRNRFKVGASYTLAMLADGSIQCGSFVFNDETTGSVVVKTGQPTLRIMFDTDYLCYRIGANDVGVAHTIEWAALYEGDYTAETLPPYIYKGYAAELAECQRYFIRFEASKALQFLAGGATGKLLYFPIHLPQPMRLLPTLTYDKVNIYPYAVGKTIELASSLTLYSNSNDYKTFCLYGTYTETTDLPEQAPACLRITAGGYIELSADL